MNAVVSPAAVVVRRTIAADAETLFDAWLDPEALATWMRPGTITKTVAVVDARVGGRYEIVMHLESGGTVPHTGTYHVIDRPRQLIFTWLSPHTDERETLVTVDFLVRGNRTEVVVTHEQLPDHEKAGHTKGWTGALEHLATVYGHGARN
jgi:uncharacterized protein YndB with AHSA1/START domain